MYYRDSLLHLKIKRGSLSSLKKTNYLLKNINNINETNITELIDEIKALNLSMYIDEITEKIVENNLDRNIVEYIKKQSRFELIDDIKDLNITEAKSLKKLLPFFQTTIVIYHLHLMYSDFRNKLEDVLKKKDNIFYAIIYIELCLLHVFKASKYIADNLLRFFEPCTKIENYLEMLRFLQRPALKGAAFIVTVYAAELESNLKFLKSRLRSFCESEREQLIHCIFFYKKMSTENEKELIENSTAENKIIKLEQLISESVFLFNTLATFFNIERISYEKRTLVSFYCFGEEFSPLECDCAFLNKSDLSWKKNIKKEIKKMFQEQLEIKETLQTMRNLAFIHKNHDISKIYIKLLKKQTIDKSFQNTHEKREKISRLYSEAFFCQIISEKQFFRLLFKASTKNEFELIYYILTTAARKLSIYSLLKNKLSKYRELLIRSIRNFNSKTQVLVKNIIILIEKEITIYEKKEIEYKMEEYTIEELMLNIKKNAQRIVEYAKKEKDKEKVLKIIHIFYEKDATSRNVVISGSMLKELKTAGINITEEILIFKIWANPIFLNINALQIYNELSLEN